MNVLSLPDEMLASALKYNIFEDLTAMRKVSSRIDLVARRYGLNKVKADSLRIFTDRTQAFVSIEGLQQEKKSKNLSERIIDKLKNYFCKIHKVPKYKKDLTQPLPADLLDILKYYVPKIRGIKCLRIYNHMTRKSISNEVGQFLLGDGCKNISTLEMFNCDISINFNTMRRIMTKLKPKELDIYAKFTEFEFSDAVIEGISFDHLKVWYVAKPTKISLPYLARLCALKIPSTLSCEVYNSTLSDFITLFKDWTKETLKTVKHWRIDVSTNTMSFDETVQSIKKLKCFEDCKITHAGNAEERIIPTFYIKPNRDNGRRKIIICVYPKEHL